MHISLVERKTHTRGPGDEEDYKTPARPAKKAKTAYTQAEGSGKSVKWDKGLVVIRDEAGQEGRPLSRASSKGDTGSNRGCLRDDAKVCPVYG